MPGRRRGGSAQDAAGAGPGGQALAAGLAGGEDLRGRRHQEGFKDGAFTAAITNQVPVAPAAIHGACRIWPPGRTAIHAGPACEVAGSPLPTGGLPPHDVATLLEQTRTSSARPTVVSRWRSQGQVRRALAPGGQATKAARDRASEVSRSHGTLRYTPGPVSPPMGAFGPRESWWLRRTGKSRLREGQGSSVTTGLVHLGAMDLLRRDRDRGPPPITFGGDHAHGFGIASQDVGVHG